jgi:CheY-like chemotaxis protein
MNELSALLSALAEVLHATCWPVLVLAGFVFFRRSIQEFLSNVSEFSLKAGASGLEASAKKYQTAAILGAALAQKAGGEETDPTKAAGIAKSMESLNDQKILRLSGKHVLWVDDNPTNNVYEQRALEVLGIRISQSLSTEDALNKIANNHYDLIISDFSRAGERQAGYVLLDKLKEKGIQIPVIIYAATTTPEYQRAAQASGAVAQTNNPQELFELVLNALLSKR